ncbi:MAG TPA: hypothetical protein HPP87_06800, partial [Planctomycetes bacterium]|nr:hypothetical protein [Planctomycetota bacterium]
ARSISYKQLAGSIVVTFEDVPLYGDKDAVNSFQVELFFADETIWITYLDLAAGGGIAGLSEGKGVPAFYVESDLSEYINCCRCGDFDGDGDVDLCDFVYVYVNWLRDDCTGHDWCERTDIDRSGEVGTGDIALAAYNWLTGTETEYEWTEPYYHEDLLWGDEISGTDPFLSGDGLTIYLARHRWLEDTYDLAEAYRDTPEGPFTSKRVISELYTGSAQICPWVSSDQLRLYYCEWSGGECCIKMAGRSSTDDTWTYVKTFDEIHTDGLADAHPSLTPDELTLFWNKSGGSGNKHVYMAKRASIEDSFTDITELTEFYDATDGMVSGPSVLPDALTMYFSSKHETEEACIYRATRASTVEPFGDIELLEFCVPDKRESSPYVTADEKEIYYRGNVTGPWGIYVTHKIIFEGESCLPR